MSGAPRRERARAAGAASEKRTQAFTRQHRLHYPWEYRRFFDRAEVFRLRECTIFRIPNELGHFRLGITLKARGTSVQRNKVKRQIRESFRTQREVLGGFDYNVVIPATKRLAHPYADKLGVCLRSTLADALKRA